ncbi:MAG: ABC transporter permease [Patulibacter minatonensis]
MTTTASPPAAASPGLRVPAWLRRALRLAAAVVATLVTTTLVVFVGLNATGGDVVPLYAAHAELTPRAEQALRDEFHLDDPLPVRYARWLGDAATGDLGRSIQFRQPVGPLVGSRLSTTAWLLALSAVLTVGGGVGLGLLGSRHPRWRRPVLVATGFATAIPTFVAAALLTAAFAVSLPLFPVFGDGDGGALDRLWHLVLPAIALSVHGLGVIGRMTQAAVEAAASREHVEAAHARGISPARVRRRHVVRNALPVVLTVSGLEVGALLGGSVIVETAFGLSGLGSLLVQAVEGKDLPIVEAVVLLLVAGFLLVNLTVDLLGDRLDPRRRTEVRR